MKFLCNEKATSSPSLIQVTLSSILSEEISLSTVISNTILNLEAKAWKPEEDIKYTKPTFSKCQNVTCEKDIWTASDINIFDALTPLDQSILFLDGRKKKEQEGTFVHSKDTSVFDPKNQIYGYICANSLRYRPYTKYGSLKGKYIK
ncbi:hypothetical protein C1646_775385 [Rhizophagus diaphanus]|nr:hypothetical protein C1646_775385 [Rhizophagus diaphanus] [Rhizophagus sp. MUCL 43196]